MHATVSDQSCYEIAHTVLVAGTFSGFISGTKMSTQLVCNEQFYELVFRSSSSQRRLIVQVHLCILYDCNKYYRINRHVVVFAYIYLWRHPTLPPFNSIQDFVLTEQTGYSSFVRDPLRNLHLCNALTLDISLLW
jgi:hypothetical protein